MSKLKMILFICLGFIYTIGAMLGGYFAIDALVPLIQKEDSDSKPDKPIEDEKPKAAGLYKTSSAESLFTWDELISNNYIKVEEGALGTGSDNEGLKALSGDLVIENDIVSIGAYAFQNCSSLTSVRLPDSITNLGDSCFANCTEITHINLPNTLSTIGWNVFSGCSNLTNVDISDGFTKIGASMFSSCTKLASIDLPSSITYISASAFQECSALTDVTIPENITMLESRVFWKCTSLISVTIKAVTPPKGNNFFPDCTSLESIYVPASSVEIYTSDKNWTTYADKIKPIKNNGGEL